MKTVIVTGAAGFIGARLVENLGYSGYQIISVDSKSHFEDRKEHRGVNFGEVIDRQTFRDQLKSWDKPIDCIFHIGACSSTVETDPEIFREWNLEYSQMVWEFCSKENIGLVYASSASTYGDGEEGYSDEESLIPRLKPMHLYGKSKQDFDLWALEKESSGNAPPFWSGFKFFNVYGFGETHKKGQSSVALQLYHQIRNRGSVRLFKSHRNGIKDGHQARDFVSVEDVVEVLKYAYEKPVRRGIFNLGTGQARTFEDLAHACFNALREPIKIEYIETPENLKSQYQYFTEAEMKKLEDEGYDRPFLSLEKGVASYYDRLDDFFSNH